MARKKEKPQKTDAMYRPARVSKYFQARWSLKGESRRERFLPKHLQEMFKDFLSNEGLRDFGEDLAFIETMIADKMGRLSGGEASAKSLESILKKSCLIRDIARTFDEKLYLHACELEIMVDECLEAVNAEIDIGKYLLMRAKIIEVDSRKQQIEKTHLRMPLANFFFASLIASMNQVAQRHLDPKAAAGLLKDIGHEFKRTIEGANLSGFDRGVWDDDDSEVDAGPGEPASAAGLSLEG